MVLFPLVHAVLPYALSLFGHRVGWTAKGPASWNLAGVLLVAFGVGGLAWSFFAHLASSPARLELALTPNYLAKSEPYRVTRNPMYVSALTLWFGWAVFFGSLTVLAGWLVLLWVVNLMVRHEERALEARHGESYLQYKRAVPRWLGRAARARP